VIESGFRSVYRGREGREEGVKYDTVCPSHSHYGNTEKKKQSHCSVLKGCNIPRFSEIPTGNSQNPEGISRKFRILRPEFPSQYLCLSHPVSTVLPFRFRLYYLLITQCASQIAPYSLWALVKRSALYREWSAIWDTDSAVISCGRVDYYYLLLKP
jgi:hypothetical protein